jgi:hypothetical protein
MTLLQTLTDADGIGWILSHCSPGVTDRIAAPVSRTPRQGVEPSAYYDVEQAPSTALGKKVRDDCPQ